MKSASQTRPASAEEAHAEAFEKLEQAKEFLRPGLTRPFAIAIADTVRGYLEARFALSSTDLDEESQHEHLPEECRSAVKSHGAEFAGLLSRCNDATSLGALPPEQMDEILCTAWRLVAATRVPPEGTDTEVDAHQELEAGT